MLIQEEIDAVNNSLRYAKEKITDSACHPIEDNAARNAMEDLQMALSTIISAVEFITNNLNNEIH